MKSSAKKCVLILTLLGAVMNVLLPFFAIYPSLADAGEQRELMSLSGGKVLVCSQGGLKWVALSDFLAADTDTPTVEEASCPLCYIDSRDDEPVPIYLTASIYLPLDVFVSTLAQPSPAVLKLIVAHNFSARAPPAFS